MICAALVSLRANMLKRRGGHNRKVFLLDSVRNSLSGELMYDFGKQSICWALHQPTKHVRWQIVFELLAAWRKDRAACCSSRQACKLNLVWLHAATRVPHGGCMSMLSLPQQHVHHKFSIAAKCSEGDVLLRRRSSLQPFAIAAAQNVGVHEVAQYGTA